MPAQRGIHKRAVLEVKASRAFVQGLHIIADARTLVNPQQYQRLTARDDLTPLTQAYPQIQVLRAAQCGIKTADIPQRRTQTNAHGGATEPVAVQQLLQ
jgi:hypothetical protein